MHKTLPAQPSLDQLKHQAKDLLSAVRAGEGEALARLREHHPRAADSSAIALNDAQRVIAREYGFASWPKLKHHVELLASVETRITRLRSEFATGDNTAKLRLLKPAHDKRRFENFDPSAASLSYADARLLVANQEGYAFWKKFESYLYLDPAVRAVIAAVRTGDLARLQKILGSDPAAANPQWVPGFPPPRPVPNDSIPLFCVAEGVWRKTNRHCNDYQLTRALVAAGAEADAERGLPLISAVSFKAIGQVEALLDCGAMVDGVDGDGVPMGYAMIFGFGAIAELLAARGARLDLRFAAALGRLDLVKSWFDSDGSLKPGAGALADPYGFERKLQGKSPFRCERTRQNILSQAFFFACVHRKLEIADFLLAKGADINALVPGLDAESTVLHRIASLDALDVVRFLLDRGADPSIRDPYHQATAPDWARYHGRHEIATFLDSHKRAKP